jgi:predicted nucleic acid-binding protein
MSGPVVLLDTSIFVGAKNSDERESECCRRVLELAHQCQIRALVSAISVAEVCVGYARADDSTGRNAFLDYLRGSTRIDVVAVDLDVAEAAAGIRAQTSLRLPDALIVGSALVRGAESIVTHDREFEKVRSLIPPCSARQFLSRIDRR